MGRTLLRWVDRIKGNIYFNIGLKFITYNLCRHCRRSIWKLLYRCPCRDSIWNWCFFHISYEMLMKGDLVKILCLRVLMRLRKYLYWGMTVTSSPKVGCFSSLVVGESLFIKPEGDVILYLWILVYIHGYRYL